MKRVTASFIAFLFVLTSLAVPARRDAATITTSDGRQITVTARGDENSHWFVAADGSVFTRNARGEFVNTDFSTVQKQRKSRRKVTPMETVTHSIPPTGSPKIPVLLVQFSDVTFKDADPLATFQALVNTGAKSVKQYFSDMSGGTFTPQFDLYGPISLGRTQATYGSNNDQGRDQWDGRFIRDAINAARNSVNYAQYDNDNDGMCDFVYVIYAGVGESTAGFTDPQSIWPHKSSLTEQGFGGFSLQGIVFDQYACSNELVNGDIDGIGTFVHEFSHALGLPDFGSNGASNDIYGMDEFSVMDYGCYLDGGKTPCAYTGYEREFLGWTTYMPVSKMQSYTLQTMANGGRPVKVTNPANENEFYVLENRQQTGWDQYLSAHGMMISHVDYDEQAWNDNLVNIDPNHKRMTIVPADDDLSIETNSGDLWPNGGLNDAFNDTSNPAAFTFTGNKLEKPVEQITESAGVISFYYDNGADAPILGLFSDANVTSNSITPTWSECNGWRSYSVRVWKASATDTATVFSDDFSSLVAGEQDISGQLNSYTSQTGWTGYGIFTANGGIRLGSVGNLGYIISPVFDASRVDGDVTVTFSAKSYNYDGEVTVRIQLISPSGSTTHDVTVTAAQGRFYHVFSGGEAGSRIKISTVAAQKRVVISDITVLVGDFSETYAATARRVNDRTEENGVITIDDIHAHEITVDGLDPETPYCVQVDVHHVGTLVLSSNIRVVRTTSSIPTAIEEVEATGFNATGGKGSIILNTEKAVKAQIIDLTGRIISERDYAPGNHVVDGLEPGIYIVNKQKVRVW